MSGKKRPPVGKLALWAVLAAVIVLAVIYRDKITVDTVMGLMPESLLLAFLVFMLLYGAFSVTVVLPLVLLYVSSGLIFGSWAALGVNLCGGVIVVTIPYFLGRKGNTGLVASAKAKLPEQITAYLDAHPMSSFRKSLLLRAVGIVPCDAISAYLGAAGESFWGYLAGSVIGLLPDMIPQTLLGAAATDPSSPQFIWSLAAALVLKGAAIAASLLLKNKAAGAE